MSFKISNCLLEYSGRKIPLLSGEFHYWRVLRENWPVIIDRIKEMGLETIATYVPWNYHETAPGQYDFSGATSPQRDLAGFLDLLAEKGITVIIRPGPYIYSEWPYGGVPERASVHDRLSPEFLKMSEHYIRAVCKVIVPRQITHGGNIILCQSDNEPYPPIESQGSAIGCFERDGMFKQWLKKKYSGQIAALNKKWRASLSDFSEACVYFHETCVDVTRSMAERLFPSPEFAWRYADTHEFIGWYAKEIVRTVAGWLKDSGIDIPIYANGWSPLYQDFTQFHEVVDLAGTDIYPMPYMEGKGTTEDEWFYNIDILKMQEADTPRGNVWSAEYQCGVYPLKDAGYLPPQHFRFKERALLARGLKGWNWYMLVNRDNWNACPINEWGRTNEFFPVHRDIMRAARRIEPWKCEPIYDTALFTYKPHRVIAPGNYKRCFDVLEEAGFNYCYFDPAAGLPVKSGVMLYAGVDFIEMSAMEKIAQFVTDGGTFVTFNQVPVKNEFGERLTGIPMAEPAGARPVNLPLEVRFEKGCCILKNAGHMGRKINLGYFHRIKGSPITASLSTDAEETLVEIKASGAQSFIIGEVCTFGKGRIVQIGANPYAPLLSMILRELGIIPAALAGMPGVSAALHRREDGCFILYVVNRNTFPVQTEVRLDTSRCKAGSAVNIDTGEVFTLGDSMLPVRIDGHDVAIFEVSNTYRK